MYKYNVSCIMFIAYCIWHEYVHMYVGMYIYVYMFMFTHMLYVYVDMCMYVYIYVHMYMIYIYIWHVRNLFIYHPAFLQPTTSALTSTLPTKS